MKKIVYIPLDERPCNYDFPYEIFQGELFDIKRVPFENMGLKKKAGNIAKISEFLLSESKDAYAAVISIDTLLYGGIVPSRLHSFNLNTLLERLKIFKTIKEINPALKIYAFNLVMRCPQYNDDDEEPDYYLHHGYNIFKSKYIQHKKELNIATPEELNELKNISIPEQYITDYSNRRKINTSVTIEVVNLVKKQLIDFLIIPQDDSAPYGYTALDQDKVRKHVQKNNLWLKVLSYPGADEVGNTLFVRLLNEYNNKKTLVYLHYPSEKCKQIYPCAEDRYLDSSARSQIIASGCIVASDVKEADIVFAINAPSQNMISSQFRYWSDYHGYIVNRNLVEFVDFIKYCLDVLKKPVTIGDIGYCNGGDLALIRLIEQENLYMKLAGYASWNIPCNSLGTALPMAISRFYNVNSNYKSFLIHRFVEDVGYGTLTRKDVRENYCEKYGYTIYDVGGQRNDFTLLIKDLLIKNVEEYMPSIAKHYIIEDIYMPWSRTYEVGLKIKYIDEDIAK